MKFPTELKESVKKMFIAIIKERFRESGGHSGFTLRELEPILDELEADGLIVKRPTINTDQYFINQ